MPVPHHSIFYGPNALLDAIQHCQSTEGKSESPPVDWYQIILLGDKDTRMRTICPESLHSRALTGSRNCDLLITIPTPNPLRHIPPRHNFGKVNKSCISLGSYYYYIRLTAFFSRTTWVSQHQKGKPFWILLEQEMMRWQWHQLDYLQIICTSLQTDNHASTSPLGFCRPDTLSAA